MHKHASKAINTAHLGRNILLASLLALSFECACAAESTANMTIQTTSDGISPNPSVSDLYTYTQVDAKGPDTVTKFKYNSETGSFDPVYYRMELKNKTYGEGDVAKGYGFTKDAEGNNVLGEGSTYTVKYGDENSELYTEIYQDKEKNSTFYDYDFTYMNLDVFDSVYTDADFANGKIENVLFKNNTLKAELALYQANNYRDLTQDGGVLAVLNNMESITADFVGNTHEISNVQNQGMTQAYGGALYNKSYIGSLNGNFINNEITANSVAGGAIYNSHDHAIGEINANFIGNKANSIIDTGDNISIHSYGGAISNNGSIGDLTGDFIDNSASTAGGAIYNSGDMTVSYDNPEKVIEIDCAEQIIIFEADGVYESFSHYVITKSDIEKFKELAAKGYKFRFTRSIEDPIYVDNIDEFEELKTYYTENSVNENPAALLEGYEVAVERPSTINANFIGNYVKPADEEESGAGGAVANGGSMSIINGDFIGNYVNALGASGGAINNTGQMDGINGNFLGNYTISIYSDSTGGAIKNRVDANILAINGDFIGNYASAKYSNAVGGAISNDGSIGDISGDFIENSASAEGSIAHGGAIANSGSIESLNGNFYSNKVQAPNGSVFGGAIYNSAGNIGSIKGDFVQNSAFGKNSASGGAIANIEYSSWNGYGEIVFSQAKMNVTGTFVGNSAVSSEGRAFGGAVDNKGDITFVNSSLINNHADAGTNGIAKGGAIYSSKSFTFAADGATSLIQGNYVKDKNGNIENNSIYMDVYETEQKGNSKTQRIKQITSTTLTLDATNNGQIIINDKISGIGTIERSYVMNDQEKPQYYVEKDETGKWVQVKKPTEVKNYGVKFTGDGTGSIVLNNNIEADDFTREDGIVETGRADVILDGANLHLAARDDVLNGNTLTANSGVLNMINNQANAAELTNITITGDTKILADVDLANKTMDRVTAPAYGSHNGNLIVAGVNLISDAAADTTEILFADKGLKDNVQTGVTTTDGNPYQLTAYTPIYKYDVNYDNREDAGYMLFTRGGAGSGNPSDVFNPAVLNTPVANLAAGQATINETFKYVFQHADAFTQLPAMERMAQIKNNYYALSTDYNENIGSSLTGLAPEFNNNGAWVRPYVTFETMNLKNGPDVDAITYGTLVGFDSDFEDFGHGWTGVTTGYVGYNGSQLSYSGNDTSMNGGLLGLTQTFYKGNFWTALTASAGASVGETSTMYGSEDFTTLLAGIGSKTGYNFEFQEGKFILQPIMFMSYTFVNTFDYTNAAGVEIESDPLHTLQLNPSVRFIANLKNGWQPYASVGMVWNLLNQTESTANGISLPDMHVKPYVEYGLGVQKRWADKFTAFFQTMIRNGGRNGVALTGGFRWSIGKDPATTVNNVNKVKKVIKSRSSKLAGK